MWMGGGAATTPTVTTSVSSKTPTEVTIKLKPSAAGLRLSVERLEHVGKKADADPLTDVSLESNARDNRVRLTVAVPEGHPSGSYSGAIRDQFGVEQGQVTVAVRDAGSEG